MERDKYKIKVKIFSIIAAVLFFAVPASSQAQVVLGYVDAWQALNASSRFHDKTVAQLIYDEATEHNINPRLILTILQRESSAITRSEPSSTTTRTWPMFYMYDERMADCLNGDESSCNDSRYGESTYYSRAYDYGGIGQQIAYSTYNFGNLLNSYASTYSTPITIDGQTITCANAASRVLFAYTPHLVSYNEGSAFYTNWVAWWGGTPNGGAYNQNNIISTANFQNSAPMTVDEINNFLISKGSWLANYTIPEYISTAYPMIYTAPVTPPAPVRKTGDANWDNAIDLLDLSLIASYWGTGNDDCDVNNDGVVDLLDLSIIASSWGT